MLKRVGLDLIAGAIAALSVTPIMLTVDKAVVEWTGGSKTLI